MLRLSVFAFTAGALVLASTLALRAGPAYAGASTATTTVTQIAPETTGTPSPGTTADPSVSPPATQTVPTSVTSSATADPPPESTTFPEPTRGTARVLSTDFSLTGTVLEEKAGTEQPTLALVEVQVNGRFNGSAQIDTETTGPLISLFTDDAGNFRFTDIPPGEHLLWMWGYYWTNVVAHEAHPNLFLVPFTVSESGVVSGAIPDVFVMREKPEGVLGFPIRTGADGLPPPTGTVSVRASVAQPPGGAPPPRLPSAGSRAGGDSWREASMIALATVALLGGGAAFAIRNARRRN